MATISTYRGFSLQLPNAGGPPQIRMPFLNGATSESEVAGSVCVLSSGVLTVDNTDPAGPAALLEENTPATVALNDKFLVTLILPSFLFEFSADAGAVAQADIGVACGVTEDAGTIKYAVVTADDQAGTNNTITPLMFASDMDSFTFGKYLEKNTAAASAAAGTTISPLVATKGIAGDTSPRVICIWSAPYTAWTAGAAAA